MFLDHLSCDASFDCVSVVICNRRDEVVDVMQSREQAALFIEHSARLDLCIQAAVDRWVFVERATEMKSRTVDVALQSPFSRDWPCVARVMRFAMAFPVPVRMFADEILRQQ